MINNNVLCVPTWNVTALFTVSSFSKCFQKMSEFPVENPTMSGIGSELTATPDGAVVANGVTSGRPSDVAAMIENFQHKKAGNSNSTSAMLNRINSNVVPVPGGAGVVVTSVAGSPNTVVVNTNPTQVVSSSSTSSSRVKRSSQVICRKISSSFPRNVLYIRRAKVPPFFVPTTGRRFR